MASIHSAFKGIGNTTCVMTLEIGALHHYKSYTVYNETVQDDTMTKYRIELMQRVKNVKTEIDTQ